MAVLLVSEDLREASVGDILHHEMLEESLPVTVRTSNTRTATPTRS